MIGLFNSVSAVTQRSVLMDKQLIFQENICQRNPVNTVFPKGKLNESSSFYPVIIDFACVYL